MREYNSPAYFLSDCHLPMIRRRGHIERHEQVVRFLREKASKGRTLFLVGDILDFWFEWRLSMPSHAYPVLFELSVLIQKGIEVVYLGGNHDGHVGDFLEREVHITVSRKPVDALIDGKKFHILHGDGLAPPDRGYRILRSLVRWKPTEEIYRLVHPDFGIWFAGKVSKYSRNQRAKKKKIRVEHYREYAEKKLEEGFNYAVMGHIHEARQFPHPNGGICLIGDWMRKQSYAVFKEGGMRLEFCE